LHRGSKRSSSGILCRESNTREEGGVPGGGREFEKADQRKKEEGQGHNGGGVGEGRGCCDGEKETWAGKP